MSDCLAVTSGDGPPLLFRWDPNQLPDADVLRVVVDGTVYRLEEVDHAG